MVAAVAALLGSFLRFADQSFGGSPAGLLTDLILAIMLGVDFGYSGGSGAGRSSWLESLCFWPPGR